MSAESSPPVRCTGWMDVAARWEGEARECEQAAIRSSGTEGYCTNLGRAEKLRSCANQVRKLGRAASSNDPKLSDCGAWRGSCECGTKDSIQAMKKGGSK